MGRHDFAIFGKALGRHQKRATEPVGQDQRPRWQGGGINDRPADDEADGIVDRFRK